MLGKLFEERRKLIKNLEQNVDCGTGSSMIKYHEDKIRDIEQEF